MLSIVYALMTGISSYISVHHLFLFFARDKKQLDLSFSLLAFITGLYCFQQALYYSQIITISNEFLQHTLWSTSALFATVLIWFLRNYSPALSLRTSYYISAFFLVFAVVFLDFKCQQTFDHTSSSIYAFSLFDVLHFKTYRLKTGIISYFFGLCSFALIIFVYIQIGRAYLKKRNIHRLAFLFGISTLFFAASNDLLIALGIYEFIDLIEFGFFALILIMSLAMENDYIISIKQAHENLTRFRVLFETNQDMTIVTQLDQENKSLYLSEANSAAINKLFIEPTASIPIKLSDIKLESNPPINFNLLLDKEKYLFYEGEFIINNKPPISVEIDSQLFSFKNSYYYLHLIRDVTEKKQMQKQLLDTARKAGITEIASNILHNVGNVLNSVNIEIDHLNHLSTHSKVSGLTKINDLLMQQNSLEEFFGKDTRSKMILPYLNELGKTLGGENKDLKEIAYKLKKQVDHIRTIINFQQIYGKAIQLHEIVSPTEIYQDALEIYKQDLEKNSIQVEKHFEDLPKYELERHKLLQILCNWLSNAKYALIKTDKSDKKIILAIAKSQNNTLHFSISDNGIGIPSDVIAKIFTHGFTTKNEGHGFGLHSSSVYAQEMKGRIWVESQGEGMGATFNLEIPIREPKV